MNTATRQQLWQRLLQDGLADGDMPPAPTPATSWYVRVMLGAAGWLGAAFLLGFADAVFASLFRQAAVSLAAGGVCCIVAFGIFRAARDNDFAGQFGLAVSLAGQVLLIAGLFNAFTSDAPLAYFIAFAIEAVLAVLLPNFIHRVLTSWAAMLALSMALDRIGARGLAPGLAAAGFAVIWMHSLRWVAVDAVWRPIGYGLAIALLQIDVFLSWEASGKLLPGNAAWIDTAAASIVLLATVRQLLLRERIEPASRVGIASIVAALLVCLLSFAAPGVASASLVLLLGFAVGNRILIGLGLLALGVFVSHYYYALQHTLLVKSVVLAASGVLLLAAHAALKKFFPIDADEANNHA